MTAVFVWGPHFIVSVYKPVKELWPVSRILLPLPDWRKEKWTIKCFFSKHFYLLWNHEAKFLLAKIFELAFLEFWQSSDPRPRFLTGGAQYLV